ncbi:MAG TPA: rhodanese-like domain-containing protein, partial [Nitrospira sp.]|nr:rhodanese-like domain-containing protein [Nitrospira sp.]
MTHPLLVETDTVEKNLGKPGLVIIDVRGRAAYEFGGHIPGAVNTTWHDYSDPNAVAKGLLDPDMSRMEQKMRALGINNDSEVVIYSNPFDNWGDEGRMFWMLEYFGHKHLRILDGGWVKWVNERRPFEHGRVTPKNGNFTMNVAGHTIIAKDELRALLKQGHPNTMILDARSLEEYLGKEVSGIPRPGHIPSAIHLAWNGFLNNNATVKDLSTIKAGLEEKGVEP